MKTLDFNPKAEYNVGHGGVIEIDMGDHYVFLTEDDLLAMLEEIKKWEEDKE